MFWSFAYADWDNNNQPSAEYAKKKIMDNIKRRGCTCVIVAHRLSAIRDCDQIIVMNRGKIVQRGSHDELAQVDGHYKRFISNL